MSERSMIRARRRERDRSAKRNRRVAAATAAMGATLAFAPAADAATFEVTNTNDSGVGSLRNAVTAANLFADADTVTFASGLSGTITLTTGDIPINASVDIRGPGAGTLAVSGNDASRIFYVDPDTVGAERDPVSISGLTLRNGDDSYGGAIYSDASTLTLASMVLTGNYSSDNGGAIDVESSPVTIVDSRLSGNEADSGGGAMYTDGDSSLDPQDTVTIRNTVVDGNISGGDGGAFYFDNATGGDVTIAGSTLSNNDSAGDAGAIDFYGHQGAAIIRSSTISGNSAVGEGGGIYFDSDYGDDGLLVENSTITGNESGSSGGGVLLENSNEELARFLNSTISGNRSGAPGGGIFRDDFDATLSSTIVAGNDNSAGAQDDLGQEPTATEAFLVGFSLIQRDAGLVTIVEGPPGSNKLGVDPQLGLLANNGGPTQTQALPVSSPAIDAGIANGLTTDQRGLARTAVQPSVPDAPGSDGTDMGAYELAAPDLAVDGPVVSAKKKQKQKGKKIKIKVKAGAAEAVSALASGKVKAGRKSYRLKPAKASVAAAQTKTLTLKPKKKSANGKIAKVLAAGKKAKATIKVVLTDAAGNTFSKNVRVTLTKAGKKKK